MFEYAHKVVEWLAQLDYGTALKRLGILVALIALVLGVLQRWDVATYAMSLAAFLVVLSGRNILVVINGPEEPPYQPNHHQGYL